MGRAQRAGRRPPAGVRAGVAAGVLAWVLACLRCWRTGPPPGAARVWPLR